MREVTDEMVKKKRKEFIKSIKATLDELKGSSQLGMSNPAIQQLRDMVRMRGARLPRG